MASYFFGKRKRSDAEADAAASGQESVKAAVDKILKAIDGWTDSCGVAPKVQYRLDSSRSEAVLAVRAFDGVTREQLEGVCALFTAEDVGHRVGSYTCRMRDRSVLFEIVRSGTTRRSGQAREVAAPAVPAEGAGTVLPPVVLPEDRSDFLATIEPVSRALGSSVHACHKRPATYDVEFQGYEFKSEAVAAATTGTTVDFERGMLVVPVKRNRPDIIL